MKNEIYYIISVLVEYGVKNAIMIMEFMAILFALIYSD